jgi:hypothetical protein
MDESTNEGEPEGAFEGGPDGEGVTNPLLPAWDELWSLDATDD